MKIEKLEIIRSQLEKSLEYLTTLEKQLKR